MIEKMTKYSFVLLSGQTEDFLSDLSRIGLMDITRSQKPVDEKSAAMLERMQACKSTIDYLKRVDWSKDPEAGQIAQQAASAQVGEDAVGYVRSTRARLDTLKSRLESTQAKAAELRPWGEFDPASFAALAEAGYALHFYSCNLKSYDKTWEETWPIQEISRNDKKVWFVVVSPVGETPQLGIPETAVPSETSASLDAAAADTVSEIVSCKAGLLKAKEAVPAIQAEYEGIAHELDLYLANESSELAAEDTVSVLVGFAPTRDDEAIRGELDKLDAYWFSEKATAADNPPIKLHNNWFARQFEVLTGMYGMPVYDEFDPTPILAPFFLLFFAMCLGDAGYGIILILLGLLFKYKMPGSSFGKLSSLIIFLGSGTVVMGTLLGSFFGVSLSEASWVPQWLKNCMITGEIAGFQAPMVLSIAIGVVHIILAMTVKAICFTKRFGIRTTISNWGWLLLLVGLLVVGGISLAGIMSSAVTKWIIIAIGVISALAIYVFNTPGRNPLVNVGAGLWDTYNMATGLISDVLSYLRLYALGLAGGMLGAAFNTIASIIFEGCPVPGLDWFFFILILLIGHTLNIAMSCLGAFVHPLRLNFLEYFKNAGYEGTGTAYRPLTETNK